jgi:hypothetical protein
VKNPSTGFICTCLLVLAGTLPGRAQEQKPNPQLTQQTAPVADTPDPQAATPQTPAPQTPAAPQPGPAQQATPQQAPTQQTQPAAQEPVPPQPTPPAPDEELTQRGRVPEPPPPPPKVPDVRRPGESGWYFGLSGWFPTQKPIFDRGNLATFTGVSHMQMQGKPKFAEGVELGFAAGLHNSVRLVYTDFRAAGDFTTPNDVVAWAELYTAGTYISTNYHVQNIKLSYEYLTWPYPVGSRKFRLKTLWQVQFTQVNSVFDSPLLYFDSSGNPITDSSGNLVNLSAGRSRRIISPMFGLGAYYYPSRHFRFEANGSGFGFPHRYTIADVDASLNYRIIGHLELRVGGRAFEFKTSTHAEYFLKGTFAAAFFGLRWYSNSE